MRRYIALTLLGSLGVLGGHAAVSLGLHPERTAPLVTLLEGCAVLVAGVAIFATGMIGLAEGYEKAVARLSGLLAAKELPEERGDLVVGEESVATANGQFWSGYARAGAGVALFLAGLLALTAGLWRASPILFAVGVAAGVVCLGVASLTVCARGLRRARRAHSGVHETARVLEQQPDRGAVEPVVPRRRARRYVLFPRAASQAEPRNRSTSHRRLGAASLRRP